MIDRKKGCPVCGYKLLARSEEKIFCLASDCTWSVIAKRKEDEVAIPDLHKMKDAWHY